MGDKQFDVGDRVRLRRSGKTGVVAGRTDDPERQIAVELDEPFEGGHDCDGIVESGNGRWAHPDGLELAESGDEGDSDEDE